MSDLKKARQIYDAEARSAWDSYVSVLAERREGQPIVTPAGAIAAARAGDVSRLADCLRARKPLSADDCVAFGNFIGEKRLLPWRSPKWKWLAAALRNQTEDDFDALADFVLEFGRRCGRQHNKPVHDAAQLTEVLAEVTGTPRRVWIDYACRIVSRETDAPISDRSVRDLLDRKRDRRYRHK